MTTIEYVKVAEVIDKFSNQIKNVRIYKVHLSYDPKISSITKITLKLNYTKDGRPLPDEITTKKVPKYIVQRTEHFRGESCTSKYIIDWLTDFIYDKAGELKD